MARVNISMPDDLHTAARQAGLNVSRLAQEAVASALARMEQRANGDKAAHQSDHEMSRHT